MLQRLIDRLRFAADHRWVPRHVSEYLDGDLAHSGRERIERHVHDCDRCRELLAGLRSLIDSLRGIATDEPRHEDDAAPKVLAGFRERIDEGDDGRAG